MIICNSVLTVAYRLLRYQAYFSQKLSQNKLFKRTVSFNPIFAASYLSLVVFESQTIHPAISQHILTVSFFLPTMIANLQKNQFHTTLFN